MAQDGNVLVVGSVNWDLTVRTARFPVPGETVGGGSVLSGLGGKGANQAVAAARAGARARILATVGVDEHGTSLVRALSEAGVDASSVEQASGVPTGMALITVNDTGENQIVVVSGANEATTAQRVRDARPLLARADVVVTQGEIPVGAIEELVAAGPALTVLNLAPYVPVSAAALAQVDFLVVNETEAGQLLGIPAPPDVAQALDAVGALARVSRHAVITLGANGAVFAGHGPAEHVPVAEPVEVVDATGAGDAFVGVLAAHLARGAELAVAVAHGVEAATRTVQVSGAAQSYPDFLQRTEGAR